MYELFNGRDTIRNIVVRSARGCGVTVIPDEDMTPNDRCYASVQFNDFGPAWEALRMHDPKDPPILHGLPIIIKLSAADMPEVSEILGKTMGFLLGTKHKCVNAIRSLARLFADGGFRRTKKRTRRRIVAQKTELVIDDQPRALAGPSRRRTQSKRR